MPQPLPPTQHWSGDLVPCGTCHPFPPSPAAPAANQLAEVFVYSPSDSVCLSVGKRRERQRQRQRDRKKRERTRGMTKSTPADHPVVHDDGLFHDPEFPPAAHSIGAVEDLDWHQVRWVRPQAFAARPILFASDPCVPSDVDQGAVGDCWFIAALAALSTFDHLLKQNFVSWDSVAGKATFRFYKMGEEKLVTVDDRLVVSHSQQSELVFCRSDDRNELWSALIEKAYAKLHGSFHALDGGFPTDALTNLTDGIGKLYELQHIRDKQSFWKMLLGWVNSRSALVCCSMCKQTGMEHQDSKTGLINQHAYSVLSLVEYKGNCLVLCRNPWGQDGEWNLTWGDNDAAHWTADALRDLHHSAANDGTFYMPWADFCKHFDNLYVCHLPDSGWKRYQLRGHFSHQQGSTRGHDDISRNPQYVVRNKSDSRAFVLCSLTQPDSRMTKKSNVSAFMNFFRPTPDADLRHHLPIDRHLRFYKFSECNDLCENCDDFPLEAGEAMVIIPAADAGHEFPYLMRVSSKADLEVYEIGGSKAEELFFKEKDHCIDVKIGNPHKAKAENVAERHAVLKAEAANRAPEEQMRRTTQNNDDGDGDAGDRGDQPGNWDQIDDADYGDDSYVPSDDFFAVHARTDKNDEHFRKKHKHLHFK